jgi:hypothetical protein
VLLVLFVLFFVVFEFFLCFLFGLFGFLGVVCCVFVGCVGVLVLFDLVLVVKTFRELRLMILRVVFLWVGLRGWFVICGLGMSSFITGCYQI